MATDPLTPRPMTLTLDGLITELELGAILAFIRELNGPGEARHWVINVSDPGGSTARHVAVLEPIFGANVEVVRRR